MEDQKFKCLICNYKSNRKDNYDRHIKSKRHTKNAANENAKTKINSNYIHEQEEKNKEKVEYELKEGFHIMQESFCELIKGLQNSTKNITNNLNSNNTNTFNINFFLNETCKDAINMKDFIESIEVTISDLKKLGSKGYVEGISSLMIDKLNELDVTRRPIHSSDVKRETIYVKDDNVWEKNDKEKITEILWDITRLETRALEEKYKSEYPKCKTDRDSKEHEEYWRIFYNAMGGKAGDIDNLQKKVIKKVIQNIAIDKTKIY